MSALLASPGTTLIPVSVDHAAALASLVGANIGHLRTYLPQVAELASSEAARRHLQAATGRSQRGDVHEWHIFVDADDRKAKVGYFIGSRYQGRGIVTASVRAVLAHCFGELGLNRIELRCAADNAQSIRVAQRLGFVLEGILREDEWLDGRFVDQHLYSLLRRAFLAQGSRQAAP